LREQYRSLSSSLCSFLHSPVTLSLWVKIGLKIDYSRKTKDVTFGPK
jgi:hypothetical protein